MNNGQTSAVHNFRLLGGTIGTLAVIVQYIVTLTLPTGADPLTRTVNYISYFTILSNVLAAAALLLPELAPQSMLGRFFERYETRTAIAVYMIVTCGVYAVLLAGLAQLTGVQYYADVTLHYIMPPIFVIDWLLIRPAHRIDLKSALYFMIFPLAYGIYTLVRGAIVGTYPYPFVDVVKLGYPTVFFHIAMFCILFLVLGLVLVAAGRWRAPAISPSPVAR
jgi:hypothetical protein